MKTNQKKALEHYSKLAKSNINPTALAGRNHEDSGKETEILNDILYKLEIKTNDSILDIGCGCGPLTHQLAERLIKLRCKITFFDISDVIYRLQSEIQSPNNINFITGIFPPKESTELYNQKFDKICIYSVMQCTDDPEKFIDKAVSLLNPQGKILIGDIPNINKKGRFLASKFGRKFDANYRGLKISEVEKYSDHIDYQSRVKNQNILINDKFINHIIDKYRLLGLNVYITPQNASLPFAYTREDMILERP